MADSPTQDVSLREKAEAPPCSQCGGWTQNEDGHRDECPRRESTALESDAMMLLVWAAWAKREGNEGAERLFRRAKGHIAALSLALSRVERAEADAETWKAHAVALGVNGAAERDDKRNDKRNLLKVSMRVDEGVLRHGGSDVLAATFRDMREQYERAIAPTREAPKPRTSAESQSYIDGED